MPYITDCELAPCEHSAKDEMKYLKYNCVGELSTQW